MTKRKFAEFLKQNLKGLPIERQNEVLEEITELVESKKAELAESLEKDYIRCNKCGKYILKDRLKVSKMKKEKKRVFRYYDYNKKTGIYDEETYLVKHGNCPFCNTDIEIERKFLP